MTVTWPEDVIPVEIFSLVVSYLPRSSVQNMRLVSKEFEEKVAHDLFQNVIVPFSPEIYGIAEESSTHDGLVNSHNQARAPREAAVMLQDNGMRVFQGFGRHIFRFGMSFEFDYSLLTKPPIKSDQEAVMTFWGIYRWPFKKYNRYHQLEGLEQVADETRTMARALRFITNAKELGLSIDGGLGWLAGPDINYRAQLDNERPRVFGEPRFRPEEKPLPPRYPEGLIGIQSLALRSRLSVIARTANELDLDAEVPALVQMLREAGYEGVDIAQSVRTLIESEGLQQPSQNNPGSSFIPSVGGNSNPLSFPNYRYTAPYLKGFGYRGTLVGGIGTTLTESLLDILDDTSEMGDNYSLNPNDLTTAQREMLLETEWAQRAFMQSYTIAVIDNATTFHGIETLSLARLPSRHLTILRRGDFWDSLSQLRKVSLAIIPDWREVVKLPTSWVEDIPVQPSRAIFSVYKLLKDHIAHRKSIKIFHFEWFCGGEEATGLFARNQLILAAPVVPQATNMVHKSNRIRVSVLELPHVEHLTLKNCWISPHIMVRFVRDATNAALTTLTLLSVSLTAPSIVDMQSGPANLPNNPALQLNANPQGQAVAQLMQLQLPQAITAQGFAIQPQNAILQYPQALPIPAEPNHSMSSIAALSLQPRFGSWADVINQISPSVTLASFLHSRDLGPEPKSRQPSNLKRIIFDSCGYIRIMLDFDQTVLDPPMPLAGDSQTVARRRKELTQYMMKPQENTLGTIVNYMSESEKSFLVSIWDLQMGWSIASRNLIVQSLMDGIKSPGQGRFHGEINKLTSPTAQNAPGRYAFLAQL